MDSPQCYLAAWMGGEFGGEWIHVYVWVSPFALLKIKSLKKTKGTWFELVLYFSHFLDSSEN